VQVTNSHTQTTSTVMVDYEHLSIRCRYCRDIAHCLRDCPSRPGPRRSLGRPLHIPLSHLGNPAAVSQATSGSQTEQPLESTWETINTRSRRQHSTRTLQPVVGTYGSTGPGFGEWFRSLGAT
jgi:hypothetical protein